MLPGGVLFIYGSVFSRQVRGALSQGPWYPMKFWHRAIFFSAGAFMLIYGLALLSAVVNNQKLPISNSAPDCPGRNPAK
jgi:hypothetical protein